MPAIAAHPSDQSVPYEAILSMPVGRPHRDDRLGGIGFWASSDYPARGEA